MIGSHNTMTCLRPRKLWMWLLLPFARCQHGRGIPEKVDCIDIRIKRLKDGRWCFAHGLCDFGPAEKNWNAMVGAIYCAYVDSVCKYIRMTLETSKPDVAAEAEFAKICRSVEEWCPNAIVFGGTRKFDWKVVYKFSASPSYRQCVGSMRSRYGKVFPWLWRLVNRDRWRCEYYDAQFDENVITLFDFL